MLCYLLIIVSVIAFVKKRFFQSLSIFFFLLLDGFQIIPLKLLTIGFFSGATIDASLLIFITLLILRGRFWLKNPINNRNFVKAIWVFMLILFMNIIYGISNAYSPSDVLKGARLYMLLPSFLLFTEVPLERIIQLIKLLIIVTFFQCILFLLQVITGHAILQGAPELIMDDLKYTRYYNTPKLLDFSLALSLFRFPFKKIKRFKIVFITIFFLTVLAPLHRGYIISWFITLGLYSIIFNNYSKKLLYLFILVTLGLIVFSVEILRFRLLEAFDQLYIIGDVLNNKVIYDSNTFVYRIDHLMERLKYINKQSIGWLVGIGLVDEKAPQVANLPFRHGLPDPVTGKIIKVYTPDLVWSMLFLTLGYVGAFFYMNIYLRIIRNYSAHIASPEISKTIFTLIMIGVFTSFTSNTLLQPHFFVPIFLLIISIEKTKKAYKKELIYSNYRDSFV